MFFTSESNLMEEFMLINDINDISFTVRDFSLKKKTNIYLLRVIRANVKEILRKVQNSSFMCDICFSFTN